MPPTPDVNLPAFLYLNPELPAYSNVRTVEQALLSYDALGPLPNRMPVLPPGFDARVFLAAQPDVSVLNRKIRDAMLAEGMTPAAVDRRSVYVGTSLDRLTLVAPNTFATTTPIPEGGLQAGDDVKITRVRGDAMYGVVTSVTPPSLFTLCNPVYPFSDPRASYSLFGIKIADPERQARVAYVRSNAAVEQDDVVPRKDFEVDMYQLMYPDTRGFSFPDTYIDYRARWKRNDDYRVIRGRDIFNLSAPYSSNLLSAASTAGSDFTVVGNLVAAACNLYVSPSNLVLASGMSVAGGYLDVGASNMSVGCNALTVAGFGWEAGGGGGGGGGAVGLASGNLAVSETGAALRSGITIADSNVVITASNVTVGSSNLAIGTDEMDAFAGSLRVSWDAVLAGQGNVVVTPSNVSVAQPVTLDAHLCIGMPSVPDVNTRLAVAGDIFATGTLVTLSDERAKTDITPIRDGLRRVCALNGYTFASVLKQADNNGGVESRRRHTGLLAQEVEAAVPEAVYAGGGVFKSVAYGNLMGVVVEALKELAERVRALEAQLSSTTACGRSVTDTTT